MEDNPYQSPTDAVQSVPVTTRPVTATVFGVINIIFGAMGILGAIAAFALMAATASGALPQPDLPEAFQNPMIQTSQSVSNVISGILSIALIVAGVGLLKFRPWGRSMSIWIAIVNLVLLVLMIGLQIAILAPAAGDMSNLDPSNPEEMALVGGVVGGVVGGCFGSIYPIVTLIFMNRSAFKEAILSQK